VVAIFDDDRNFSTDKVIDASRAFDIVQRLGIGSLMQFRLGVMLIS